MSKKEKAFCVNWYPNDYLSGTMYFTLEQKGAYVELLMLQCNTGAFTIEQAKIVLGTAYSKVWVTVAKKFETDGAVYWNARMKLEIEKRNKYSKSRNDNLEGTKPPPNEAETSSHMVIENTFSSGTNSGSISVFGYPSVLLVSEYFEEIGLNGLSKSEGEKFVDYYESKGWMVGKSKMKNWKAACRNWKKNLKQFNQNQDGGNQKVGRIDSDKIHRFVNGPTE